MKRPGENDQELAKKARGGDGQAFEELVRLYQRMIYGFLFRLSGSKEDAMELTQLTFVKSWMAIGSFRGESSFRTYLYTVAANAWRNTLRDRYRRPTVDVDEIPLASDHSPHEEAEKSQQQERLWILVDRLPRRQKEVVLLRIREGLSFVEAARIMGCSIGAAKANYHQAVKRLRGEWREDQP